MYAPKFRSWLSAWDRLDMQIDRRADEYKAEIHAMAASAKAEFAEPEPSPDMYVALAQMQALQNYQPLTLSYIRQQQMSPLSGLGNILGQSLGAFTHPNQSA